MHIAQINTIKLMVRLVVFFASELKLESRQSNMWIYSLLIISLFQFSEIFGDKSSEHQKEIVYVHDEPGNPRITVFVRVDNPLIDFFPLDDLTSHIASCMIHNSNDLPTTRLLRIDSVRVSHPQIEKILHSCVVKNRFFDKNYLEYLADMMTIGSIFPGTKWCGQGDISDHDEDLGYFDRVDACCRMHDKCPDFINPNETQYGLTNWGKIAR